MLHKQWTCTGWADIVIQKSEIKYNAELICCWLENDSIILSIALSL